MELNAESGRYWQNWDKGDAARRIDKYWRESEEGFRDRVVDTLLPELGRGTSVLEVGCGSGLVYEALHRLGVVTPATYVGGDVSRNMLALARQRFPGVRFVEQDILKLDCADRAYSDVICVSVLQHLPYYDMAVRELLRVTLDRLFIVSWFKQAKDDELNFCEPSPQWDGQPFQNNSYSLPKFVSFVMRATERPIHEFRVCDLGAMNYLICVHFGAAPRPRRSLFQRLGARVRRLTRIRRHL